MTRTGGIVLAAAISRYATLLEGFYRDLVDRPGFTEIMHDDVRSGRHRNPGDALPDDPALAAATGHLLAVAAA